MRNSRDSNRIFRTQLESFLKILKLYILFIVRFVNDPRRFRIQIREKKNYASNLPSFLLRRGEQFFVQGVFFPLLSSSLHGRNVAIFRRAADLNSALPLFPVTIDLETLLPSLSITACVYNRHAARARLNLIPRVPIARHRFFPTTDSLRRFAGNNSDDFIARRYETRRHDRCLVRVRANSKREKYIRRNSPFFLHYCRTFLRILRNLRKERKRVFV